MEPKTIKLSQETIRAINFIQEHYYFGMFKQMGIAQNEEVEYILRNALDDFSVKTQEDDTNLLNFRATA